MKLTYLDLRECTVEPMFTPALKKLPKTSSKSPSRTIIILLIIMINDHDNTNKQ